MTEEITNGIYRHYKNKKYKVLYTAVDSETKEEVVVYQAMYGENKIWVRPKKMFLEEVEVDGQKKPRFEFISEDDDSWQNKYPEPVVGILIYNDNGEIFLTKSSKWGNHWQIPGGHVELGETEIETTKREIMEETGLEIDNIKFEGKQECIFPKQFEKKVHFIFHDYSARLAGGEIAEKNREMEEYIWIKPEEALKKFKLNPYTRITIERFIEKKGDNYENLYKRALADYQNLLKQTAKEKMEFAIYANEQMLREILPVYDHLKLAIERHNGESTDDWLKGVEHVVKQFRDVLEKIGVEEIKAVGEKFSHNLMEAVGSEETEAESLDGVVAKQVKAGYRLNGKVIEPAKVIVYKLK